MRLIHLCKAAAALALVLPSLAWGQAKLPVVSLIVFPGGFNWPIWVADEQGFFARNGIAVTVTPTPGSVYQLTHVIDGTFDVAVTAIDNIVAYDEGQGEAPVEGQPDLVAFMGGDNGFLRLVTVPSVGSYAALRGKELTVDALTTGYSFVLQEMLEKGGLHPGDYTLVRAGGALERFNDLMAGKHAGTLLLSPFEVPAEAKGFHLLGSAVDVLGHYQGIVMAARRPWVAAHGPEVAGFIRAYREALDWLYDPAHHDEAIQVLRTHLPSMSEPLAMRAYAILLDPAGGFTRDAAVDMDGVRTVLRLRSKYGHVPLDDPGKYLDLEGFDRQRRQPGMSAPLGTAVPGGGLNPAIDK